MHAQIIRGTRSRLVVAGLAAGSALLAFSADDALARRKESRVEELVKMLESGELEARYGACEALERQENPQRQRMTREEQQAQVVAATIELLDDWERAAYAQLSVFATDGFADAPTAANSAVRSTNACCDKSSATPCISAMVSAATAS